jgi:hypothetical protein
MAARMAEGASGRPLEHALAGAPPWTAKTRAWRSNAFGAGDVWPAPNYQIAKGLARYGHKRLAGEIADKTVANAIKNGISEHYDSVLGKPLGVPFLGMSCTLVTLLLAGSVSGTRLKLKVGSKQK